MDHSGHPVSEIVALFDELESVHDDFDVAHRVIALIGDSRPSSWQKTLLEIADREPRDALLGFTAPSEIWALGTIGSGWVAPLESADDLARGRARQRPSAHPDACRMRMISITTRDGLTVGRLTIADGRQHEQITDRPDDDVGVVAESVRRALGLPTAPPSFPPRELFLSIWLNDVVSLATDQLAVGTRLTWNQVAGQHPAVRMLRHAGHRTSATELVSSARALDRVASWDQVRDQCAERAWLAGIVEPHIARWMDTGMLARWLTSAFPPLTEMLSQATRLLRTAIGQQLSDTVAEIMAGSTDADAA